MGHKDATEQLAADAAGIARAAELLREGRLVAVPTETVYGLAARADDAAAIAEIYHAKGRPEFNPLIVHVATLEQGERLAVFDAGARALATRLWPGPLTLVLPLREDSAIAPAVTAGLPTIALRSPAHPAMRAVIEALSLPLAAPSANRSGGLSPTRVEHVLGVLGGRIAAVLDGGASERGVESTIVALRDDGGWQLLRPGPVTAEEIAAIAGPSRGAAASGIEAPGQLAQHYAPGKPVRLAAKSARADEFLIGFGAVAGDCTLSATGDLAEAAAQLYACLHRAAAAPHARIAVATVPQAGIGAAINDRLRRAAA